MKTNQFDVRHTNDARYGAESTLDFVSCGVVAMAFLFQTTAVAPVLAQDEAGTAAKVIVDYSELNPQFPGESGIFRNPKDNPQEQFIQESLEALPTPNGGELGFLKLHYIVKGEGTYNGYFWKYDADRTDDWNAFAGGALVLRINKGNNCTPVFKVEVKAASASGRPLTVFKQYAFIGKAEQNAQLARQGYLDVILPFNKFQADPRFEGDKVVQPKLNDNLASIGEIVIVFENSRIPKANQQGVLLINQIRVEQPTQNQE